MNDVDLFISHSSGDADAARELRTELEAAGYSCWMAPDDVTGRDPWAEQILAAIQHSRAMLVLISSRSNKSNHVAREVGLASGRGLAVLPVRIAAVVPEGALEYHLAGLQRLDVFPPPIADHRERLLRRLATVVPLALPPTPAERGDIAAEPVAPAERGDGKAASAPRGMPESASAGSAELRSPVAGTVVDRPPESAAGRSRSASGLSAWARANSMLAGALVTLVALFLVATIALALSGPGAAGSPSAAGPSTTPQPTPAATADLVMPSTVPTSSLDPSRPPEASGGAFPNAAEIDLYLALPDFGKDVIADCERSGRGDDIVTASMTCHSDNGELMFYELYADLANQQQDYRSWVRNIMGNPNGSCATSPEGDSEWSRTGAPGGRLACYRQEDGGAHFSWTDELRLVTTRWYGSTEVDPISGRSPGYQLFLDWTAD